MKWEVVDLKDAPESLQSRVNEKFKMYDGDGQLLQVVKTEMAYNAYLNAGNLCTVLTVWNFNLDEVNEDSMTVGEIQQFMKHPEMKFWFS